MKIIPLTQGYEAIVDDEDYDKLIKYSWQIMIDRTKNPPKLSVGSASNSVTIYMARLVLPRKEGFIIDHKDRNTLDNRKSNLRYATYGQNKANSKKLKIGSSQYKGVCLDKTSGRWRARIGYAGNANLGSFVSEEAAARAYDKAAIIEFGEFARLNFPE